MPERYCRRLLLSGLAAALVVVLTSATFAQSGKTVRLIYPFAAGSGGDTMARISFRDAESARWAPAVKAPGFKPEQ